MAFKILNVYYMVCMLRNNLKNTSVSVPKEYNFFNYFLKMSFDKTVL